MLREIKEDFKNGGIYHIHEFKTQKRKYVNGPQIDLLSQ